MTTFERLDPLTNRPGWRGQALIFLILALALLAAGFAPLAFGQAAPVARDVPVATPSPLQASADAYSGAPAQLSDAVAQIDLWPYVKVLSDPQHDLSLAQVLLRSAEFTVPDVPYANLGPRTDTVWLRIPYQTRREGTARWYVTVSYVLLDEIQFFEVCPGQTITHPKQGMTVALGSLVGRTRTPGAQLMLPPGQSCELLVRVRKLVQNALLMPISVSRLSKFVRDESEEQLWQGLCLGLAVCLLGYALVQSIMRRGALHLWFALFTVSGMLSSLAYFGVGAEFFWPGAVFPQSQLSLLGILLMATSGIVFSALAINLAQDSPAKLRAVWAFVATAFLLGLVYSLGWMAGSTMAYLVRNVMPFALLVLLPIIFSRLHKGDRVALLTLAGWVPHGAGLVIGALLHRGNIPWNWWTDHAMELGFNLHLLTWSVVMSLRMNQIRVAALSHQIEKEVLLNAAQTDALTGQLNRRGLAQAVQQLAEHADVDTTWTVYLSDLDGFKAVNDNFGHRAGDLLLTQVASRLRATVGADDLVCRLGGDEFVVLTCQRQTAVQATALGRRLVATCQLPFSVEGHTVTVGMTVGFSAAQGPNPNLSQLLKRADAAMYVGKSSGKNRATEGDSQFSTSLGSPFGRG